MSGKDVEPDREFSVCRVNDNDIIHAFPRYVGKYGLYQIAVWIEYRQSVPKLHVLGDHGQQQGRFARAGRTYDMRMPQAQACRYAYGLLMPVMVIHANDELMTCCALGRSFSFLSVPLDLRGCDLGSGEVNERSKFFPIKQHTQELRLPQEHIGNHVVHRI